MSRPASAQPPCIGGSLLLCITDEPYRVRQQCTACPVLSNVVEATVRPPGTELKTLFTIMKTRFTARLGGGCESRATAADVMAVEFSAVMWLVAT